MRKSCVISSYCSIRNNSVVIDNNKLYSGQEPDFFGFSAAVYRNFSVGYPKFHKMDNLSKLGFLSTELLLKNKNIEKKYPGDNVGIIFMNASSSLDTDRHHQAAITDRTNYFPSPAVFVYTLPNVVIGEICIRHKFYGEGNFFIMENFDPVLMVNYVEQLFETGVILCCIAGWVEIDGNDFNSLVFLIENSDKTDFRIANFEPAVIRNIFGKKQ